MKIYEPKSEEKIYYIHMNNKWAKIKIGEMGIRRKKERKAYEMSRGMKKDFERIEGKNTKSEEWKPG